MIVTYDPAARTTYIRLAEGPSVRTDAIGDLVAIDFDEAGEPVGVELLMLPNRISRDVIETLADEHPKLRSLLNTDAWLRPAR